MLYCNEAVKRSIALADRTLLRQQRGLAAAVVVAVAVVDWPAWVVIGWLAGLLVQPCILFLEAGWRDAVCL
jgi:hypothetical protein